MKRAIPLLLLAGLAAAYYFFVYRPKMSPLPANQTQLRLSGNIEAHETLLSFKVPGRIVALPVEEGQWVEAGAEIARLEADDFRQQVAFDESAVRVREAELQLALAGSRRQEIESLRQAVREAEAELAQRRLDLERAEQLWRKDAGSKQDRDRAETAVKRAEAALERAREQLDLAREGTRQEQIAIAQAAIAQAREKLRLSRLNLEYAVLRAPTAGVVLVRQAELGEVVAPGTPVVTLADLDRVWLRAYLPETDLGRVKWGQEVEVRTDTFPDKTYRGRVSFIASRAEFTPRSIETHRERVTLVYRLKIDVENPNHELKPGMPTDAIVLLGASARENRR
jgi:HlyD family secretion protein